MTKDFPSFIDSTMLSEFRACPRKFYWHYLHSLVPGDGHVSWHLHAGKAYAAALNTARQAWSHGSPWWQEQGLETLIREYGPQDADIEAKSLPRIAQSYALYWQRFPIDQAPSLHHMPDGAPATEFTFSIALPIEHPTTGEPLLYCGRFDWIASMPGSLWVADDKTCTSLGSTWASRWPFRSQLMGYVFAAWQYGINVHGALVRGCAMTTTPTFAEIYIPFPEWKIMRWYEGMLTTLKAMIRAYEENSFPEVFDEPCIAYGGCQYQSLCNTHDPSPWLAHYKEETWDPLQ